MKTIHDDKILILDFGSQYTQLIARRVRQLGVYCEVGSCNQSEEQIKEFNPKGIILSGGPETVTMDKTLRAPAIVFQLGVPVLGICYGMQTMALQLGGQVSASHQREFGFTQLTLIHTSSLFSGIEDTLNSDGQPMLDVWMSHGDHVTQLPSGFQAIAKTGNTEIAAIADEKHKFYGVQFHPEVTHTRQGMRIIERFLFTICQCEALWKTSNIIEETIVSLQQQVGEERVLLGLSGGVDSAVAAALLYRAIGQQLICVFVDTGLLRYNEAEQVQQTFARHLGIPLITVDAKKLFFKALQGIEEPEQKRKIIGALFVEVFNAEAQKLSSVKWLAQGTIYSDVIESAALKTGNAHIIKSHHNVGGLPEKLPFKLIEPLREFFKDEVRQIGLELGLPHELLYRHPFPGPGLGVRVLGEVLPEYVHKLQQADAIFIDELHRHQLYDKVSQAFCVFLPIRSVGVIGDARQYEPVIAIRAVETIDFMTAQWARLPYDFLEKVSLRIVNEVAGISRVVYDISGKPPATIEWE